MNELLLSDAKLFNQTVIGWQDKSGDVNLDLTSLDMQLVTATCESDVLNIAQQRREILAFRTNRISENLGIVMN